MRRVGLGVLLIAIAIIPVYASGDSKTVRDEEPSAGDADRRLGRPVPPSARTEEMEKGEYLRLRDEHIARLRGWEPGKPFDPTARIRAIQQMEKQEALHNAIGASKLGIIPLAFPSWVNLGPNPLPNGQTTPVNPVSGRVTAIDIDPTDPNKVYAGAAQGGVYRSLDGGATWTSIFDSAQTLAIGALTLDAANGRLYVGTGEANNASDSYSGVGLYRIDNVNTNPILVGPINPVRNYTDQNSGAQSVPAFNGAAIGRILIVPNDPTKLFVATNGYGAIGIGSDYAYQSNTPPHGITGLYRLDGVTGAPASVTITKIAVSATGGCFDIPCTGSRNIDDMVFDPGDTSGNTLIVWQNGNSVTGDGGVWRSIDAMGTTPAFTHTFVTTAGAIKNGRGALAIYKEGANAAVVYVASGEPASGTSCITGNGALRLSTDGGVTFGSTKLAGGGGFCGGQCTYNIGFAVNPGPTTALTDDIVYLGGIDAASTTVCSLLAAKSTNGAATFVESNGGVHADVHVIKIAPSNPNILYRGDDGGIFKSTNAGVDWTSLNNTTFIATQYQSIAVHPTDQNFSIGGTQDNGTHALLGNLTWNLIDYGDGGFALIDQNALDTTTLTMYHTYYNLPNDQIGFASVDTYAAASSANWPFFGCSTNVAANGIICTATAVAFYAPMALGPGSPNTVYFGSDRLYRSINKGVNNTVFSQAPLVSGVAISDIAISPQDDTYRIVGLANGALFYTVTGSLTLTVLDPTGTGSVVPDKYVARIVFDPFDKHTAYIAVGGYMGDTTSVHSHVWKVTGLATTPVLTAINGSGMTGLPDVPVNAFAIDPMKTTRLFAGTDIGVYDSEDGGATWSPFGLGLPRVAVFDMAVQNGKRVVRIATHGRGMWEMGLPPITQVIVNPPSNVTAVATSASSVNVSWSPAGTSMSYQVWRSNNNGAYAQVPGSPTTSTSFVDSVSPDTTYLYKIKSVDGSANVSPFSDMDFASTVIFPDDPIVAGSTPVKVVHLTRLRTAVNAMQLSAGVMVTNFTDPTVDNTLPIRHIHVEELRTALNAARAGLGVRQLLFTNPTLQTGVSLVKAIDFQEIRDGVK
jgi:hypothetical protein